jgi:hypothetical protein
MNARTRGAVAKIGLGAGALVVAALCGRGWPKDREVRYVLGSRAPDVVELDAAWTDEATGESVRDASFRYVRGRAPRVVVHAPSLPDGRYTVTVTLVTVDGIGEAGAEAAQRIVEHVDLRGDTLSLDVAARAPRAPLGAADPPRPSGERRL